MTFGSRWRPVTARWSTEALLLVIAYWVCLTFIFPKYFSPVSPSHTDFYAYTGASQIPWSWLILKYPRPVAYLAMHAFGMFGLTGLMILEIATALASVLLTVSAAAKLLDLKFPFLFASTGFYAILLFAHPQFYIEHRHDLPAEVSYLFLMAGFNLWLVWRERRFPLLAVTAFFCIICFAFAKETFFISALCLFCLLLVGDSRHRRADLWALVVVAGAELSSYLWTRHINSPFVKTAADSRDPYFMDTHVASVARIYGHYVKQSLTIGLAIILLICLLRVVPDRKRLVTLGGFMIAGLTAYLPLSVLPNHVFDEYAWAGVPLLFAPALVCFSPWNGKAWNKWPLAFLVMLTAMVIWTGGVFHKRYGSFELQWTLGQEHIARNIVNSFGKLRQIPKPSRVLVVGIETPFSPWSEPNFVRAEFGDQMAWTTVVPSDTGPTRADRLTNPSVAGDVILSDYDYLALYHADGSLAGVGRTKEMIAAHPEPAELLVPGLETLDDKIRAEPNNEWELAAAAKLCVHWGDWGKALEFADRALSLVPADAEMLEARRVSTQQIEARHRRTTSLVANPAAIVSSAPGGVGVTELVWDAPGAAAIELHVGAPNGPILAAGGRKGSARTGPWVKDGMEFYLQDVSGNRPLTSANTLAKVRVSVIQK